MTTAVDAVNPRLQEIMNLLQEEAAEVIQEVSKCRRFGLDAMYGDSTTPHRLQLAGEIGDLLVLVDLLVEEQVFTHQQLTQAKINKLDRLRKWTNIFAKA